MQCLIDDKIEYDYNEMSACKIKPVEQTLKSTPCFYCNHLFDSLSWQMPVNKKKDKFIMWGNYCSLECARSFVTLDSHSFNKEKCLSLLALYAMKCFGKYVPIEKAPSKFLLQMYGGPLTIEQFRAQNKSQHLWVCKTPDSCTTHMVYDLYIMKPYEYLYTTQEERKTVDKRKRESEDLPKNDKIRRLKGSVHNTKKSLQLLTT